MKAKNRSRPAPKSSSSNPTVVSERSDALLALGKKLIAELKLGNTNDTLSRWMVHYLAGLIKSAERRSTNTRGADLDKCFEAIMALWQHRHELPNGKRPFEKLEPILRTLEALDPRSPNWRYFPSAPSPVNEPKENKAARDWLQLAESLDYSARILIRRCLVNAAGHALDKSKEWVRLAEQMGDDNPELTILRIIIAEDDFSDSDDLKDEHRRQLEDRIARLKAFLKLAKALAADYGRQLKGSKSRPKSKMATEATVSGLVSKLKRPEPMVIEKRRAGHKRRHGPKRS